MITTEYLESINYPTNSKGYPDPMADIEKLLADKRTWLSDETMRLLKEYTDFEAEVKRIKSNSLNISIRNLKKSIQNGKLDKDYGEKLLKQYSKELEDFMSRQETDKTEDSINDFVCN